MLGSNLLWASLFSLFLAGPALAQSNIADYFQLGLDNIADLGQTATEMGVNIAGPLQIGDGNTALLSQSAKDEGFNRASQTQLGRDNLASLVQSASEQGMNLSTQLQIGNSLTAILDYQQATDNLASINVQIQTGTDNFSYMAP
jgi:hypothetical protein